MATKVGTSMACTMARPAGRAGRIIAGLVIIALVLTLAHGTARTVVAIVGLVPILAGLINICAFSALLGGPLNGWLARSLNSR